jgi:D-3-phosphoglycerate dehydrogenase
MYLLISLFENIHQKSSQIFKEKLINENLNINLFTSSFKLNDHKDHKDEIIQKNYFGILGIRSASKLNKDILNNIKIDAIGAYCIGTDQIDLQIATMLGIPVFNSPFSSKNSVSEMVMAQLINLSRGVGENLVGMRENKWCKTANNRFEIRGRTLGIIGYGQIGQRVSHLAQAFGMKIIFYDIDSNLRLSQPESNSGLSSSPKRSKTLEDLLIISDYVTLHVPLTSQTENMINDRTINMMKDGAFLLNASRGNVVNISAVTNALKSKKLSGFYADVFPLEPQQNGEWIDINQSDQTVNHHNNLNLLELQSLPINANVIMTSHVGGSTIQAQIAIAEDVTNKLIKYYQEGSTIGAVNLPNLELLPFPLFFHSPNNNNNGNNNIYKYYRITYMHKNLPGALYEFDGVFQRYNINIVCKNLSTKDEIGYCILDFEISFYQYIDKKITKILKEYFDINSSVNNICDFEQDHNQYNEEKLMDNIRKLKNCIKARIIEHPRNN